MTRPPTAPTRVERAWLDIARKRLGTRAVRIESVGREHDHAAIRNRPPSTATTASH